MVVKISRHGPIISDVLPLAPPNCAMQWVGADFAGVFEGLFRVALARNFDDFRKGASHIRSPTLNLGYADVDGHIGYQFISPPGQSGHYKSPHYDDQAAPWAEGHQFPMRFDSADELKRTLILKPGS